MSVTSSHSGEVCVRVELPDNASTARVIIHGEAERANLDQLEGALANIELDGRRAVQIDVSSLEFFDVAALRQLAAFVTRMRHSGRDATIRGAQPLLRATVRALGAEDELGLT